MYSNDCPMCKVLQGKLNSKNISYVKSDNFEKIIGAGFRTVPVLEVDGEMMDFRKSVEWVNNIREGNE